MGKLKLLQVLHDSSRGLLRLQDDGLLPPSHVQTKACSPAGESFVCSSCISARQPYCRSLGTEVSAISIQHIPGGRNPGCTCMMRRPRATASIDLRIHLVEDRRECFPMYASRLRRHLERLVSPAAILGLRFGFKARQKCTISQCC